MNNYPEDIPNTTLSQEIFNKFNTDLDIIRNGLELSGLIAAPKLIRQVLARLPDLTFVRLHENLLQIQEMMIDELKDIRLSFIPKEQSMFLDREHKEKENLAQSFPSTLEDYKEAIFCYVNGRHTAAVFHAMRVLEYGLEALAKDVSLNFDVQQWGNIIDQIEKEIKTIRVTMSRGLAKNERLQFLSESAKEFTYFKDGWRNYVAHRRVKYDGHQALSVINHVKAFMIHLSTKIAE